MHRPHPRNARVEPSRPRAWATCDRCGLIWQHERLSWQYQWAGFQLINERTLVCPYCLDRPQQQLRSLVLPPDPPPLVNPRPEAYTLEENFGIGDNALLLENPGDLIGAFVDLRFEDSSGVLLL